jgi:hypothetical protein
MKLHLLALYLLQTTSQWFMAELRGPLTEAALLEEYASFRHCAAGRGTQISIPAVGREARDRDLSFHEPYRRR